MFVKHFTYTETYVIMWIMDKIFVAGGYKRPEDVQTRGDKFGNKRRLKSDTGPSAEISDISQLLAGRLSGKHFRDNHCGRSRSGGCPGKERPCKSKRNPASRKSVI